MFCYITNGRFSWSFDVSLWRGCRPCSLDVNYCVTNCVGWYDYGPGQFIAVSGDEKSPDNIAIVLEEEVVIDSLDDFATAVCMFFAVHYVLNLQYANGKKSHMFECFQKIFMHMASNRSPKMLSLNVKLQS